MKSKPVRRSKPTPGDLVLPRSVDEMLRVFLEKIRAEAAADNIPPRILVKKLLERWAAEHWVAGPLPMLDFSDVGLSDLERNGAWADVTPDCDEYHRLREWLAATKYEMARIPIAKQRQMPVTNKNNAIGPRTALTKLLANCFDGLKREGRVPHGRTELLQAVRAADPEKKIVQYIPDEGDRLNDELEDVIYQGKDGKKATMKLHSISEWLRTRKKNQ